MSVRSLPPYRVMCYARGCESEAQFKIASRWSDGVIGELKTYFLACAECLPTLFHDAGEKKRACRLASFETLGDPEIFELTRGRRDQQLARRRDLER